MTAVATITRANLAQALAVLTDDELVSLAYGEHAPTPLLADVPAWLAEAAYDELDRRMMAVAEGFALEVSGPVNVTLYAADFRQFNAWVAEYRAKGCDVNAVLPPMPHLAA